MHFIVNYKDTFNQEIYDLFQTNYKNNKEFPADYQYKCIKNLDYWFILYDEKTDDIIAECSVIVENDNIFEINDVLVKEKYRGTNYSVLLLMNILYFFGVNVNLTIKIMCDINNSNAYYSYKKIFDEYKSDDKYAYFSIKI
jgi:hypothetical protein